MRWIPLATFCLCLTCLALSLATLLVGIPGNHPRAPAIVTFNISSLGLSDYYNLSSPLHHNISALIPSSSSKVTNTNQPPSITQYLNLKDWYTLHYQSNCSGYFLPSRTNPSLLTPTKINTTCQRRGTSYIFSLGATLQQDINPSVKALADEVVAANNDNVGSGNGNVNTGGPVNCLLVGISMEFLTAWYIPFSFGGRKRGVIDKVAVMSGIATILLLISSALITHTALAIHHSAAPIGDPTPSSTGFLSLTWTATACMFLTFCLALVEWKFETCTPPGLPITTYGYRNPRKNDNTN